MSRAKSDAIACLLFAVVLSYHGLAAGPVKDANSGVMRRARPLMAMLKG